MIDPADITACLVTKGDTDMDPIIDSLPYGEVIVYDNSVSLDMKVYGRYAAIEFARNPVIYFQDDDCMFHEHEALMAAYEPGMIVANWGHGETPAGFDDLPLVCGGALVDYNVPARAFARYLEFFPTDDGFLYEADFICGVLSPFKHVHLPFEILDLARDGSRLAAQPWQREMKMKITNQARWVRDHQGGQSKTDSMSVPVARFGPTMAPR